MTRQARVAGVLGAIVAVVVAVAGSAHAQDKKGPPITKVALAANPKIVKQGKLAIYKGEADKVGVAFQVDGLGIDTPVAMFLYTDKAAPTRLQVKADASKKWDKKFEPDPKTGVAEARFRTEGTAYALVNHTGETRAKYTLAIWVGPNIKFHKLQRPPFVTKTAYDKKKGAGSSGTTGTIVALAILGTLVIGGFWFVRRKLRGAKVVASILVVGLAGSARGDGTAGPIDISDLDPSDFNLGPNDTGFRLHERLEDLAEASERAGNLGESITSGLDTMNTIRGLFEALSDLDAELDASIGDDGAGPEVPSSCADNPACNECFTRAYGEVNFVRNTLARLRSIAKRTISMIEAAESFGDNVSGIHGMSGLAWQSSRQGIEQERANFNRTTRAKYDDLIAAMRRNLEAVAECERQHYNNPDWYSRFGFMYFNFIKEAYQPPD